MKRIALNLLLALCCASGLQATEKKIQVEIHNDWDRPQYDAPIAIPIESIGLDFPVRSVIVRDGDTEIPSQLDDLNGDRHPDELAFVIDMPALGSKVLDITFSSEKPTKTYPSRVYATMNLKDKKGKHAPISSLTAPGSSNVYNFVFPHGPAFESELVAYRVYFNRKQTLDIYGKFNKGLELEACGFYPNDEQLAKGFGDDVLRVFDSCGPGTLKGWNGEEATHITPIGSCTESILAYGPIRTVVEIIDNDWQYQGNTLNMTTRYILYAGHRDVEARISFAEPLRKEVFCTGVQDITGSVSYSDHQGLVACWGTDWPVNDTVKYAKETVGLATCIPQRYVQKEVKDKSNYLYLLGAEGQKGFTYHLMFTSTKETFGYKGPEEWFSYAKEWKEQLEHPCRVVLRKE